MVARLCSVGGWGQLDCTYKVWAQPLIPNSNRYSSITYDVETQNVESVEVFGRRIVDFLARNVADLKKHGHWDRPKWGISIGDIFSIDPWEMINK